MMDKKNFYRHRGLVLLAAIGICIFMVFPLGVQPEKESSIGPAAVEKENNQNKKERPAPPDHDQLTRPVSEMAARAADDLYHRVLKLVGLEQVDAYLEQRPFLGPLILIAVIGILSLVSYILSKKLLAPLLNFLALLLLHKWGRYLKEKEVFNVLNYIPPGLVVYIALGAFPGIQNFARKLVIAFFMLLATVLVARFISALVLIFEQWEIARKRPIRAYFQLLNIFIYIIGILFMVSFLINKSLLLVLSGAGALAAVLMFVFRETILSFTANIQLSSQEMLRINDYIEIPRYGISGTVIEIGLNNLKIKNIDNSIVYIPPHKILQESFRNLRTKRETSGRTLSYLFYIAPSSIVFPD
jgi:miniconductance mechanosensitive channel